MIFSSPHYIFIFLPIVFFGYFFLCKINKQYAALFLILSSLFFYSYWKLEFLPIIIFSILFNYYISVLIFKKNKKNLLITGIVFNLLVLFFFKYLDFFLSNLGILMEIEFSKYNLAFPLALSFFTLQQITYLVDVYESNVKPKSLKEHFLFVSFFPQLIAGPIVYYKNLVPQFQNQENNKINLSNVSLGIFYFSIGIFKKSIGDYLGTFADVGFNNFEYLTLVDSWIASYSFTLQLYFDFCGYTDMALGSALLFNIKLPRNFNNPLMSLGMINFWKNWHITLTSFIFAYVYTPILKSFNSISYFKIMFVTLLCFLITGLWHGASWGFLIFGAINGLGVVINHLFNKLNFKLPSLISWILTILTFNISCIFFRSENLNQSYQIIKKMFDLNNIVLPVYFNQTFLSKFNFFIMRDHSIYSQDLVMNIKIILIVTFGLFIFKYINLVNKFKINYIYVALIVVMIVLSVFMQQYSYPFIYFKF